MRGIFTKRTLNAFAGVYQKSLCYKNASKSLRRCRQGLRLSRLPLFASFFVNMNAVKNRCYSKYSKNNTQGQGQVLEEVAGKTDGCNVFAQVTIDSCHKFINFFFGIHKTSFLSLLSVGES